MPEHAIVLVMVQWRQVVGAPGYEVSDQGQIRSWKNSRHPQRRATPILLKVNPAVNGYLRVSLRIAGKTVYRNVHALVMEAFVGPRPEKFETRHLNGNKQDARLVNLAYGTMAENHEDRRRLGEGPHHMKED